jgi:EAL domain-containing protein (putative c-di-GMP-specific phosphodiesterase class I)
VGYRARPRFPLAGADLTDWLQAAERHGYRSRFAAATLTAVLKRREELPANSFLLVEFDASALHSDGVLSMFRRSGDLSAVVFEVTRFEQDRDHRQLTQALDVAREHGAMVALRATGTGHADPHQLADLTPQFVKVGAGLVAGIDAHPRRAAALAAIASLAGQLDAKLIADGLTRQAELNLLCRLGVGLAQGPLVGGERELMTGLESEPRELMHGAEERPDHLTSVASDLPCRTRPATIRACRGTSAG